MGSNIIVTQNTIGADGKFKFKVTSDEPSRRFAVFTENGSGTSRSIEIKSGITHTIHEWKLPKYFVSTSSDCTINDISVTTVFTPLHGEIVYCTFTSIFTPSS